LKRRPRLGFRLWKKIAGVSKVVADKNPLEQFFPPVKRLCEAHSKCYKLIKNLDCAVAISSWYGAQNCYWRWVRRPVPVRKRKNIKIYILAFQV
jgi:hypothetical protein